MPICERERVASGTSHNEVIAIVVSECRVDLVLAQPAGCGPQLGWAFFDDGHLSIRELPNQRPRACLADDAEPENRHLRDAVDLCLSCDRLGDCRADERSFEGFLGIGPRNAYRS